MATKEEITARLKAIDAERKTLRNASKQAASTATLEAPKLAKALSTKTIAASVVKMGGRAAAVFAIEDGKLTVNIKTGGSGGSKSPSRSRAAKVEDWIANGKSIDSAMPSKVIKAIGEDYGADSPERWLDKNVVKATAAKVQAVIDGKRIPVAEFVKAHPAS